MEGEHDWEEGTELDPGEEGNNNMDAGDETESDCEWAHQDLGQQDSAEDRREAMGTAREELTGASTPCEALVHDTQPTQVDSAEYSTLGRSDGALVAQGENESRNVGSPRQPRGGAKQTDSTEADSRTDDRRNQRHPSESCASLTGGPDHQLKTLHDGVPKSSGKLILRRPLSPPRRTGQGSGVFLASRHDEALSPRSIQATALGSGVGSPSPHAASRASSTVRLRTLAGVSGQVEAVPSSPSLDGVKIAPNPGGKSLLDEQQMVTPGTTQPLDKPTGTRRSPSAQHASTHRTAPAPADQAAAPASRGSDDSSGFLSSAEPPARGRSWAARERRAPSTSSSEPVPSGWFERQLAAPDQETPTHPGHGTVEPEAARVAASRSNGGAGAGPSASPTKAAKDGASVPGKGTPVVSPPSAGAFGRKSPAKPTAGPDGWIQTRGSRDEGIAASAADQGGRESSTGGESSSQDILALGVPPERRASPACPPGDRREAEALERQEVQELDQLSPPATAPLPDTQDMLCRDMSQERRWGLSGGEHAAGVGYAVEITGA